MHDTGRPRTGVRVVEVGTEREAVDLGEADHWYIVITSSGAPILRIQSPSPGASAGGDVAELLLSRCADPVVWRRTLTEELRGAFAAGSREHSTRPTVSVLVCTHRRPHHLPFLLAALDRLDPAPDQVIVVDNDPGDADCRDVVERSGAQYVREDRRGQDNARNAGLALATGDVVAFTDDDCVPAPDWLAFVAENFADPLVAVSTGPGFPWALDTTAQERIERQGGFMRGLERREYDWRTLPPIHAGAAGAGANMMVRRSTLAGLPAPWPPELGPGTPTESGDDTYVLSRFLAAGYRIVYDPRQWFRHQHRADREALRKAVRGYGIGSMCMLLKSLADDGETEAPRGLSWIGRRYVRTQGRRLLGLADAMETVISADYVRGAAAGPGRLRASRRAYAAAGGRPAGLDLPPPRAALAPPRPPGRRPPPSADVTAVVALEAGVDPAPCLGALRAGDAAPREIVTVGAGTEAPGGTDRHVTCVPADGVGARWNAGAAAAGACAALFLRASMVPGPSLVAAHAHQLAGGSDVVVGAAHALPADDGLASSWAALETRDAHRSIPALTPSWAAVPDGNVSIGMAELAALGGFGEGGSCAGDLVRRACDSGRNVTYDATATVAVMVRATVDELADAGGRARWALPLLERLKQRHLWSSLVRRVAARPAHRSPAVPRTAVLDLARPEVPPPSMEPPDRLEVVLGPRRLGVALLIDRPGAHVLAQRIAALLDADPVAWAELAVARGWARPPAPPPLPRRLAVLAAQTDPSLASAGLELAGLPDDQLLEHVRTTAQRLSAQAEWLLVVAPGLRAERALLDDLAPVLSASKLGCIHGARSEAPLGSPLTVIERLTPEVIRSSPVDYVLVRTAVAAELSKADIRRAVPEARAALLWIADRAVDRGWLLGRLDVRGLSPQPDGAPAARVAGHRAALGWWLGAGLRDAAPGRDRRVAGVRAGVEVVLAAREHAGTRPLLRGMASGVRGPTSGATSLR